MACRRLLVLPMTHSCYPLYQGFQTLSLILQMTVRRVSAGGRRPEELELVAGTAGASGRSCIDVGETTARRGTG